jgi:hypothetical protein
LRKINSTLQAAIPDTDSSVNIECNKEVYTLNSFFNPKKNTIIEIYKFREAKKEKTETTEQFVTRLLDFQHNLIFILVFRINEVNMIFIWSNIVPQTIRNI